MNNKKGYKKKDRYPKYLYVIYEDTMPIYVGVTALPVSHRFQCLYRSEYIMQNKHKLTYRIVDYIFNKEQLHKEEDLIRSFLDRGYKLENKLIAAGSGLPTGGLKRKKNANVPCKINGDSANDLLIKNNLRRGLISKSHKFDRIKKIEEYKKLLDLGYTIYQISKELNLDYGNLYKFIKKYVQIS